VLLPELEHILAGAGFGGLAVFGDLAMSPFDPITSTDLVVVAVRETARP
jgi:hypothetical protein